MSDAADPRPRGWDTRRVLMAVLGLQLGIAVFLGGRDILATLPDLARPSTQPQFDRPVAPGDQTRRYSPRDMPLPENPARPYTNTSDLPSRLSFERAGDVLHLKGAIEPGDAERFAEFLAGEEGLGTVRLTSPGGSVRDALGIGRSVREAALDTVMEAGDVCFSACPYILAAGTARVVDADAAVGVHQHYFGKNTVLPAFLAVEDIQRGQGEVMAYLDDMEVDPLLMRHALVTPPDEIYVLVREELETYRMVTAAE